MRPISDLQRRVEPFQVISDYVPAGDQPAAIAEITKRINAGKKMLFCWVLLVPESLRQLPG